MIKEKNSVVCTNKILPYQPINSFLFLHFTCMYIYIQRFFLLIKLLLAVLQTLTGETKWNQTSQKFWKQGLQYKCIYIYIYIHLFIHFFYHTYMYTTELYAEMQRVTEVSSLYLFWFVEFVHFHLSRHLYSHVIF